MKTFKFAAALSLVAAFAAPAHAGLVTNSFAGTVVDFSQFTGWTTVAAAPVEVGGLVGESISATSNAPSALLYNGGYGLGNNGSWDAGRQGYAGLNNTSQSGEYLQFTFNNGPVSEVGGFVNYADCGGGQCSPGQHFIIEVLDASNNSLASFDITNDAPISTPNQSDAGAFRGIDMGSDVIYSFRLYNAVNVIDDLTFTRGGAVPEPASIALFGVTLLGLGAARLRQRK